MMKEPSGRRGRITIRQAFCVTCHNEGLRVQRPVQWGTYVSKPITIETAAKRHAERTAPLQGFARGDGGPQGVRGHRKVRLKSIRNAGPAYSDVIAALGSAPSERQDGGRGQSALRLTLNPPARRLMA